MFYLQSLREVAEAKDELELLKFSSAQERRALEEAKVSRKRCEDDKEMSQLKLNALVEQVARTKEVNR